MLNIRLLTSLKRTHSCIALLLLGCTVVFIWPDMQWLGRSDRAIIAAAVLSLTLCACTKPTLNVPPCYGTELQLALPGMHTWLHTWHAHLAAQRHAASLHGDGDDDDGAHQSAGWPLARWPPRQPLRNLAAWSTHGRIHPCVALGGVHGYMHEQPGSGALRRMPPCGVWHQCPPRDAETAHFTCPWTAGRQTCAH